MKKIYMAILLATLCPSLLALTPSDFKWELAKEKNGIKIFKAPQHKETGIVPIKAQTILGHPMPRILSILATTERKKEWIPNLEEAFLVAQKSKYERVEYTRYDSPWPFNDRTFVITTKGRYNEKDNTLFIDIQSSEHPGAPLNPKYVRGRTYIGSIYMKGLTKETTFFEITLLTDFKGNIPAWIINIVQASWPFKMFTNLKKQLEKDDIKIWPEFQSYNP